MRWKVVCASALVGAAFVASSAVAQQVQNFGRGDKVHILADVKLKPKQRKHFRQFKSQTSYFSYFYIAVDDDHSVYFSNMHIPELFQLCRPARCNKGNVTIVTPTGLG